MSELINRQAAIEALRYAQHRFTVADEAGGMGTVKWSENVIYFDAAVNALSLLLSAQPERKKGKWINYKDEHCCSVCDWVIIEDCWDEENRYDYCPYCGADMRGDEDE